MKELLILLLLSASLMGQSFSTRYDVNVGMFGKVGYADVTLEEEDKNYSIKLVATTTGTAATFTGKRVETYLSEGKIIDGKYRPDTFVKIKSTTREKRVQTYSFDHANKTINLHETNSKWVSHTSFDTVAFKIIKKDVQENTQEKSVLDTYNENDVLSSYLNTKRSCNAQNKKYSLLAIGAHNKEKHVTLSYLDGLEKSSVKSSFSSEIENIYNLNVEAIDKDAKTVNVLIGLDNDGHMKEAVLGSVFWIGEIKAKRVYHQFSRN